MRTREYQVEVTCRQRAYYRVAAEDADEAERIAAQRWHRGERSDLKGVEWCELESVRAEDHLDEVHRGQDDQLLLRFIREREALLVRLGHSLLEPSVNDAISADQAASDLGWVRAGDSAPGADTLRAALSLERLCDDRALVSFERERFRSGERGEIRLYCTPEYLERLSEATLRS